MKIVPIFFVLIVALLLSGCATAVTPANELSDPVVATSATESALVAAESAAEMIQEPSLAKALLAAFPNSPQAEGEVVFVTGKVMDTNGVPIANAAVEFWQTDANGTI